MKTLRELQELRNQKFSEANALLQKAKTEEREFTPEETSQFDALDGEIDQLDKDIEAKSKQEKFAQKRALTLGISTENIPAESRNDKKAIESYSVLKVVRSMLKDGKPLDGIEREMHQEAEKEAREIGETIYGVGIPRIITKRDNSVTMPTQPEDGSAVVEKDVRYEESLMTMLRNRLVTRQLGATVYDDLVGNTAFTRLTERPKATWKAEVGALDKSNVKFATDELAPKRLGTYTVHSLQFLRQTAPSIERRIRQEITYSIAEGIDEASIFGTGTNNQPMGILNHAGVAAINVAGLGTNGAALTRANLIALRTALLKRNLVGDQFKWLINAATEGALSNTPIATGSDKFILEDDKLLGYPYVMSNMVPSNITKGSGTNLSAAIFGDWSELLIGLWGGIDLLVDPYTLAGDGQIKIVAQAFANTLIHRPEGFAYFKDIVTA